MLLYFMSIALGSLHIDLFALLFCAKSFNFALLFCAIIVKNMICLQEKQKNL